MSHGLYQVWVELFRGRECTTFGFILVHFLYQKWNRKTDTQKWNNDVPKQSQTWYNDCTKKERTGFPTLVYQYAPKIDPHLGGNWYMEWFTFERKRYDTMHRTTGSGHMFLDGSRKGTYFLGQAAQNLTVQSKVCAKNFLVNIVYKFCK